jgi:hypothetical protein
MSSNTEQRAVPSWQACNHEQARSKAGAKLATAVHRLRAMYYDPQLENGAKMKKKQKEKKKWNQRHNRTAPSAGVVGGTAAGRRGGGRGGCGSELQSVTAKSIITVNTIRSDCAVLCNCCK